MAKPASKRTERQAFKNKLADMIDDAVSTTFNKAAMMGNQPGAPRGTLDFMRWFEDALSRTATRYRRATPRRATRK
jgi:hypothetical protein